MSPSPASVNQVTITGPATLTTLGERVQFTATIRLGDGSTQDQTNAVQWASSDPTVISVSSSGLVAVEGAGRADLRASFQGVTGGRTVEVTLAAPRPDGRTTGRIDGSETVADLLTYHQNALAGQSFRRAGIIARWDLPVPVFVDASASRTNVERALAYWQTVTGLTYTIVSSNNEPRILVRAGTDGLGATTGRGLVDGTYGDNRARSGLVVIRPDVAQCNFAETTCAFIYEHELGHAIGFFDHVNGGGIMSGGLRASRREVNMLVELYRLPHSTRIEQDGSWRIVP